MGKHRLSFTERRRASMRMQFVRLEQIEKRAMITEPISVAALSLGLPPRCYPQVWRWPWQIMEYRRL